MKRLFAIALLLAGAAARAQSDVPQVTAHIQPDSVMIGDRFDLMVDVEKDLVQVVQFPEFEDKPGSPIELHKEYPVDTLWAPDSLYLEVATFQIDSTSQ